MILLFFFINARLIKKVKNMAVLMKNYQFSAIKIII